MNEHDEMEIERERMKQRSQPNEASISKVESTTCVYQCGAVTMYFHSLGDSWIGLLDQPILPPRETSEVCSLIRSRPTHFCPRSRSNANLPFVTLLVSPTYPDIPRCLSAIKVETFFLTASVASRDLDAARHTKIIRRLSSSTRD